MPARLVLSNPEVRNLLAAVDNNGHSTARGVARQFDHFAHSLSLGRAETEFPLPRSMGDEQPAAVRTPAGDVRLDSMKRVASAVGEGAMAVYLVHRYLATI